MALGRRDAWWRVPAAQRERPPRRRTIASTIALVALTAALIVALAAAVLGAGVAGPRTNDGRGAVRAAAAASWRGASDAAPRGIPPAFASGALLVTLLTTSALTIRLDRRPRRRGH